MPYPSRKLAKSLLFILGLSSVVVLFVNCNSSKFGANPTATTSGDFALHLISEVPYTIDSGSFTVQNFKIDANSGPIYFQFISACASKCAVVVVSLPYTGSEWSQDPLDGIWAAKDPSHSGVLVADVNGPGYNPASNEKISYYNSTVSDAVGFGGVFLNSGVSAVMVYNRFYLGRDAQTYVEDFRTVLGQLHQLKTIDTARVGLLGASLGGFVSIHGARQSGITPLAAAGVTPLLDLPNEQTFMATPASRITANPTQLEFAQSFFNSYLRRMVGVDVAAFTAERIASDLISTDILVIHDTWDTVVPIQQWQTLSGVRAIDSFIYQHATPIDYNTFSVGHAQASEGYTNNSAMPIYMSYLLNRLKAPSEIKNIYYFYNDFLIALVKAKEAKDRGQSINWIKNLFTDLCADNTQMKDISGTFGQVTGAQFAGGVLVNVWNAPTTIENGCGYLAAHPNFF